MTAHFANKPPAPPTAAQVVSPEIIEQVGRRVVGQMRQSLPGPSHPGPFRTVETRLRELHRDWEMTRVQRARVSKLAEHREPRPP